MNKCNHIFEELDNYENEQNRRHSQNKNHKRSILVYGPFYNSGLININIGDEFDEEDITSLKR